MIFRGLVNKLANDVYFDNGIKSIVDISFYRYLYGHLIETSVRAKHDITIQSHGY